MSGEWFATRTVMALVVALVIALVNGSLNGCLVNIVTHVSLEGGAVDGVDGVARPVDLVCGDGAWGSGSSEAFVGRRRFVDGS